MLALRNDGRSLAVRFREKNPQGVSIGRGAPSLAAFREENRQGFRQGFREGFRKDSLDRHRNYENILAGLLPSIFRYMAAGSSDDYCTDFRVTRRSSR